MTPLIQWTFIVQFLLALVVIALTIFIAITIQGGWPKMNKFMRKLTCRTGKTFPQVEVCKNSKCMALEEKMVAYMRKVLAFEDDMPELKNVVEQLRERKTVHHREGMTFEEGRHEMMQCIRTTLVKHPDDLRGRRRGNQARQILIYHVYSVDPSNDVELDIGYKIETFFDNLKACILTTKNRKIGYKMFSIFFSSLKALIVWGLDVYSDIAILLVMIYCGEQVAQLLEAIRSSETDFTLWTNETDFTLRTNETNFTQSCSLNTTSILQELIREETQLNKIESQLVLIQNIFSKYIFQLKFVFLFTTIEQGWKATYISEMYWIDGLFGWLITWCLFIVNVLASPILLFCQLPMRELALMDPNKEVASTDDYKKEISLNRNRYQGSIIEAFLESLKSCKTQVAFYLAFSYLAGTPAYGGSDQLMSKLLKDDSEIFTFEKVDWHGMPVIAFSAMMSLISISLAQFKLYRTRHEYDMSIMGKVFYLCSALLATYVKLASQIMFYTIYIIAVIDPSNSDSQFFVLQLPNVAIFYIQLQTVSIINWWTASSTVPDSGYSLAVNTAKVWPTTSNLSIEARRIRGKRIERPYVKTWSKTRWIPHTLRQTMKGPNIFWIMNIIFPFLGTGLWSTTRLNLAPQQFSFKPEQFSRNKFRFRFLLNIGLNFLLICSTLVFGWLILLVKEDTLDLEKQLATRNALYIWLSLIPCYFLALFLFKLFYDYFHVWRKENVVVGYEFETKIDPGKEWEQKHFKGHWVAHINDPWVAHGITPGTIEAPINTEVIALLNVTNKELVEHKGEDDSDETNVDDEQPNIVTSIESGDLQSVRALLQAGFDINKKDDENWTPLHRAAMNNMAEIVKHLIDEGAEVNAQGGEHGNTALHTAVEHEDLEIVKILFKGGANMFQRNFNGQNALRMARLQNRQPIRRFFCSKHPLYCSCKCYVLPCMLVVFVLHLLSIMGIVIIMFDHLFIQVHDFIFC